MNTLQTVSTILSMLCLIITTVLAWVMMVRKTKTEVSFTGTPLDKKEFENHQRENRDEHEKLFAKFDLLQFRITPVEGEMRALREASDTNSLRLLQMDAKIDRLIERTK